MNIQDGEPLLEASRLNDYDIVTVLVERRAKLNIQYSEPLIEAVSVDNPNSNIVKLLVDKRANFDDGEPLLTTVNHQNYDIVKLLIDDIIALISMYIKVTIGDKVKL